MPRVFSLLRHSHYRIIGENRNVFLPIVPVEVHLSTDFNCIYFCLENVPVPLSVLEPFNGICDLLRAKQCKNWIIDYTKSRDVTHSCVGVDCTKTVLVSYLTPGKPKNDAVPTGHAIVEEGVV